MIGERLLTGSWGEPRSGVGRWPRGWMEPRCPLQVPTNSPSFISSIAVATITHLHLHNKIWRANAVAVERERKRDDVKWKKKRW